MSASADTLALRSRVLAAVREFFVMRDFIEVETPVRLAAPPNEVHIDAEPCGEAFLRTSPELHLKRLLAAGMPRLFEMGPCFRQGERGRLHAPEYTMLEWYRAGVDYEAVLEDAQALLVHVAASTGVRTIVDAPWHVFTVQERFLTSAGWDPIAAFDADRFDLDLVNDVEPALPAGPVVLKDYPAPVAALARCAVHDPRVAERWELYIDGVELANAFSELTDAVEQRRRFEQWSEMRQAAGKPVYPVDEAFLDALEAGMPACAGVALGIDRLVMILSGASSVAEVRAFSGD